MKVIFLDIDGVLNTQNTFVEIHNEWKKTNKRRIEIDSFRVEILSYIVKKTDAKIVLSSTWRFGFKHQNGVLIPATKRAEELTNIFKKYGLKIYDITMRDSNGIRQNEIYMWLKNRNDIESFIVIDDDIYDLLDFKNKELIQTTFYGSKDNAGLCINHVKKAVEILNSNEYDKKIILNKNYL